ncbi:MAG: NAD-dependent epimerase/dehydratase family protein [Alphaproteobacteria bacterium]|jgi:UDP-glucose 4-epimerase|uniref:Putative NADH dehydrogenase n=1 Tax=viral metagenome TaxID=1070528 RepID=A0A6M3XC78_9ZZZZ|nr:NAD-dependent epimerase/dehydratase family protein [Alphaproteobacteria bacterium]MBU1549465.1 NAD-dependent epimerase/dehydratase family protein [Alphaproteobacteria bacterium]MBU2336998.1 NAD-dependent epimerase/dehydratase family protein [Alphaproteobacteria bacterium]MBU2391437.1 NAD-dependent epimerase/dehydratase family protein [Alphaproteobacteria bacterium]
MRTCVIGGGGFIGLHVVNALIVSGRDVLVLGRRVDPPARLSQQARYQSCDAGDRVALRAALEGCGEIIDLAHASTPKVTVANPILELQDNIVPLLNLLEAAQDLPDLRKLLVASSGGTVYGIASDLPISEDHPTSPVSSYGITKLVVERYALIHHLIKGLPSTVVRPANAYGPGQKPFTGQGFIATAMGMALSGKPVTIFGAGDTIRDYIHVRDVASGLVAALSGGLSGEAYNIGTAVGLSNLDVVESIKAIAVRENIPVEVNRVDARGIDVPANILSYEKLRAHTGWRPRETFEAGLSEMWQEMKLIMARYE